MCVCVCFFQELRCSIDGKLMVDARTQGSSLTDIVTRSTMSSTAPLRLLYGHRVMAVGNPDILICSTSEDPVHSPYGHLFERETLGPRTSGLVVTSTG